MSKQLEILINIINIHNSLVRLQDRAAVPVS